MIQALRVIYWKYNVEEGVRERMYGGSGGATPGLDDYDIQLVANDLSTGMGVIQVGNLNQIAEDEGGRLSTSSLLVTLFNKQIFESTPDPIGEPTTPPTPVLSGLVGGTIGVGFGIFEPLKLSAGSTVVVMECRVFALRQNGAVLTLTGDLAVDPSMQIGEVNTYPEFLRDPEVSIIVGYVEANTIKNNVFGDTIEFEIIALDKLLSYINGANLELDVLPTYDEVIDSITEKFPFAITESSTPSLGTLWWLNKFEKVSPLSDEVFVDGDSMYFTHYTNPLVNNNSFVIQYTGFIDIDILTSGIVNPWSYFNRINFPYGKNVVTPYSMVTRTYGTIALPAFTGITHTDPGIYLDIFSVENSEAIGANFQSSLLNCAGPSSYVGGGWGYEDLGYNRCPYDITQGYTNKRFRDEIKGFTYVPDFYNNIISAKYTSAGYDIDFADLDFAGVYLEAYSADTFIPVVFTWDTTSIPHNWKSTRNTEGILTLLPLPLPILARAGAWESIWLHDYGGLDGSTSGGSYKRIFFTDIDNKQTLFSYPAPESCTDTHTLHRAMNSWHGIGGSNISGDIRFMTPHLDIGDYSTNRALYDLTPDGTADLAVYNKYPVYWTDSEGNWFRTTARNLKRFTGSTVLDDNEFGIDGPYWQSLSIPPKYLDLDETWNQNTYLPHVPLMFRSVPLSEVHPSANQIPLKPIFTKDGSRKREIWFYSADDTTLYCLTSELKLKYAFKFACNWNQVLLGLDGAGYLVAQFLGDDFSVWARFEPTSNISIPDVRIEGYNAEEILSELSKFSWSAWWVDFNGDNIKLNIKRRYTGEERGDILCIANSYKHTEFPLTGTYTPPNRQFNRTMWEMFYDSILCKSTYGDIRVGLPSSIYTYNYNLAKGIYHVPYANRIANLILGVYGQRREMIEVPTEALRMGVYDYFKLFSGDWCMLEANTDFTEGLQTDIRAISKPNTIDLGYEPLYCISTALWTQGDIWLYGIPEEGCYCSDCNDLYVLLMDAFVEHLDIAWVTGFPTMAGDPRIIYELTDLLISELIINESLRTLYNNYINCLRDVCSFSM